MKKLLGLLLLLPLSAFASDKVLNLYAWTGEIPDTIVRQFEKETGIKVNFATYENNEIMYAKLRASKNAGYDVVMPSSYFVDRMRKQNMLAPLDKSKIPNWQHLNPQFLNPVYDPGARYAVPYIWGATGIFVNKKYYDPNSITSWNDLWDKRFYNSLLALDDTREMFSMALIKQGFSANDSNVDHIKDAYQQLKALMPNIKVFSSDTVISIMVDEDASIGMSWNGDAVKAQRDNPNIVFVYPKEGFVVWVDNFAIPMNAPHKDAAYTFINFIQRPDIARSVVMEINYPTTNLTAQHLLPEKIRNNPAAYPSKEIMKRAQFQRDLNDDTLALYEKYWDELKMSG